MGNKKQPKCIDGVRNCSSKNNNVGKVEKIINVEDCVIKLNLKLVFPTLFHSPWE